MGLIAKDKGGGDFTPIPEDLHLAVCYGIWDIGTQFSEKFGKATRKVVIVWELPHCRGDFDGKNLPRAISKRYTVSLHMKAQLRRDLESWRGKKFTEDELKGFDLKKLLGAPCQIQVLHSTADGKTYANIAAITKAPTGTTIKPENPVKFFSFDDNGTSVPDGTPEWIMALIRQSEEFQQDSGDGHTEEQHIEDAGEGVPF